MKLFTGSCWIKASAGFLFFLCLCQPAAAQTDFDSALKKADQYYREGQWEQSIQLIQTCLSDKEITEIYKSRSYKLLGLVYISLGLEIEVKDAVKNFLLLEPSYKINIDQDPPALGRAIETIAPTLVPDVSKVTPIKFSRGAEEFQLVVTGNNFSKGSIIQLNGMNVPTEYVSSEKLMGTLNPEIIPGADKYELRVYSPIMGGKVSNALYLVSEAPAFNTLKIILNGAVALPISSYAAADGEDGDGFAKMGFGFLGDLSVPLGSSGFGWFSTIGIFYNQYDNEFLNDYFQEAFQSMGFTVTTDFSGYMIVPLFTGIGYMGKVTTGLNYILTGQFGLSLINGPESSSELTSTDYTGSIELGYDMSATLGFSLGLHIVINDLFTIGLRYMNLGSTDRDYSYDITLKDRTTGFTDTETITDQENMSVSVFMISLGVMF